MLAITIYKTFMALYLTYKLHTHACMKHKSIIHIYIYHISSISACTLNCLPSNSVRIVSHLKWNSTCPQIVSALHPGHTALQIIHVKSYRLHKMVPEKKRSFDIGFKVAEFAEKSTNCGAAAKYIQWTNSIRLALGTQRNNTRPRIVSAPQIVFVASSGWS